MSVSDWAADDAPRPRRVSRFEDLLAWQKARELHRQILVGLDNEAARRAWSLRDQIQRSAVSVMANIAEGHERTGSRELLHALSIAKGSCAETRSHLYAAFDAGYLPGEAFDDLLGRAEEVSRLIGGLIRAYRRSIP